MKIVNVFAAVAVAASTFAGHAQTAPASGTDHAAHHATSTPQVDGEVRKVDKEQGKVTLRHGPIPNLEMGGMTMVFRVADSKMLDSVKEGDKVKFTADKVNGVFTVTSIQAGK